MMSIVDGPDYEARTLDERVAAFEMLCRAVADEERGSDDPPYQAPIGADEALEIIRWGRQYRAALIELRAAAEVVVSDGVLASRERLARAIETLGAALQRTKNATAWQPIETAPKDGTRVLALLRRRALAPADRIITVAQWDMLDAQWCSDYHGSMSAADRADQPTHWQPLPHAP